MQKNNIPVRHTCAGPDNSNGGGGGGGGGGGIGRDIELLLEGGSHQFFFQEADGNL